MRILAVLALLLLGSPAFGAPVLYASLTQNSPIGNIVSEANPTTYDPTGFAFGGTELVNAQGIAQAANGEIFVVSEGTGEVHRYDANTGALLGTLLSGLNLAGGNVGGSQLAFGPDGNLYLGGSFGSFSNTELRRYDPVTGGLLGTLSGVGASFAFGSDGLIYGSDVRGPDISRYQTATFAPLGVFATASLPGASDGVTHLAFGSDGTLYAMNEGTEPVNFEGIAQVSAYDGSGIQIAQSSVVVNHYGFYDLAVNPFTGEIVSLTDETGVQIWDLSGSTGFSQVGSLNIAAVELLFAPEASSAWLIAALGWVLLRRRARSD